MANPILIKRSAVAAKVPATTDLQLGELAINTVDGKLYLKKNNGTESIVEVGTSSFVQPDDVAGLRVAGATGKLRILGYSTSIGGPDIQAVNAAESFFTPMRVLATSVTLAQPANTNSLTVGAGGTSIVGALSVGKTGFNYAATGRNLIELDGASQAMVGLTVGGVGKGYFFADAAGVCELYAGTTLQLSTNGNERARFSSAGNLLIGSTVDDGIHKLQVNGAARTVGSLRVAGNAGGGIGGGTELTLAWDTTGGHIQTYSAKPLIINELGNNVGIGTTTPQGRLSLGGGPAGKKLLVYDAGAANPQSGFGIDMTGASYELGIFSGSSDGANGRISFGRMNTTTNAYTEQMQLSTSGNLLIGRSISYASARLAADAPNPAANAAVAGWIAGDFGGSGGTGNRVVMGSYANKAIIGGHNNDLTSWATLVLNDGGGNVVIGPTSASHMLVGTGTDAYSCHTIQNADQTQGGINFLSQNCFFSYVSSGSYGNNAACSIKMNYNTVTGRSINAGGTINASGADYAEYMDKADGVGTIAKGDVVGVDAQGNLTDLWADAVSFVVKSTNPSYVGSDTWGSTEAIGMERPVDEDGESYEDDLAAYEAALEAARQKVDRIAFAGQVPVNVTGATPGQFIIAVQDGQGIKGQAVNEDDLTLKQYIKSVGIVQNILPDGRANIRVKVA